MVTIENVPPVWLVAFAMVTEDVPQTLFEGFTMQNCDQSMPLDSLKKVTADEVTDTFREVKILTSFAEKGIEAVLSSVAKSGSVPITMLLLVLSRVGRPIGVVNGVVCLIKFPEAMYAKA